MPTPTLLVATWDNGLFRVTGDVVYQELTEHPISGLRADGRGGVLAIAGEHSLRRRSSDGAWTEIARSELALSCCVPMGDAVFVGTDGARVMRVDADGTQECLTGFDAVEGRERWYAGSAIVDGKRVGPPLGVRSMGVTCDGVLLVNVHVGGVPRSTDAGVTWRPTLSVDSDVHQVCAHSDRPEMVIAAAAVGLCVSRDGGVTWTIEHQGMHARPCYAVAFGRKDIFVSAATDPFTREGAVYRRPIGSDGLLEPVGGGFPRWTDGKADTHCIATRDAVVAVIDWSGRLYVSEDDGASWTCWAERMPGPSGLEIVAIS